MWLEDCEAGWLPGSLRAQSQRKTHCPVVRISQGLSTLRREPGRAPDRNPWTKQPLRTWPSSRERRARGFPPAPSLTRGGSPLGFQPPLLRLLSRPPPLRAFSRPLPLRSTGSLPRSERAEAEGGEKRSATGASAQAPSGLSCRRESERSAGGGVRGRDPGASGLGARVGRGWGRGIRDARRFRAQVAARFQVPLLRGAGGEASPGHPAGLRGGGWGSSDGTR